MDWQSHSYYTLNEKRTIQMVALVCSFASLAIIAVTFYWFLRMRRRIRHKYVDHVVRCFIHVRMTEIRLIMLHVMGGFVRELWYLIFSIIILGGADVTTQSPVCQVSGFFINFGSEVTGKAVLRIELIRLRLTKKTFLSSS